MVGDRGRGRGHRVGQRRLAAGAVCGGCFVGIASLRTWDLAMDTLSQVLVIVVISVALAVPLGIWTGASDRAERLLRPILDAAQVMPAFVYLVPVIFLFRVGRVPGVIASVIYAVPPCIRLVSLGLRQVPIAPREAAISFGATPRQELVKVQLPMAARAIMLGINQTILMVLSMVVIAGLIGAGGSRSGDCLRPHQDRDRAGRRRGPEYCPAGDRARPHHTGVGAPATEGGDHAAAGTTGGDAGRRRAAPRSGVRWRRR